MDIKSEIISLLNNASINSRTLELAGDKIYICSQYVLGVHGGLTFDLFKKFCENLYTKNIGCPEFKVVSKFQIIGECKLSYEQPHRIINWEK